METVLVKAKKLTPDAILPEYVRSADVCLDLYTLEETTIKFGETVRIKTGIALEIPEGYEGIVRPRSGVSSKGILVHIGTIDTEYRGDINLTVSYIKTDTINGRFTDYIMTIPARTRIAQLAIRPIVKVKIEEVEKLSTTERGANGYGSSDKIKQNDKTNPGSAG